MDNPAGSPLPLRHLSPSSSRTPAHRFRAAPSRFEYDELADDIIPCSPFVTQPTQLINRDTQPTQIVNRTVLGRADPGRDEDPGSNVASSSPVRASSIVEVPASSPFQTASSKPPSLGSRLAPAGTVFRPPPARQPSANPPSRSNPKPVQHTIIELSSDSDDEYSTRRADIRPTNFQKKISEFRYNPQPAGNRGALANAFEKMANRPATKAKAKPAAPSSVKAKRPSPLPDKRPAKRRLVQGRRPRTNSDEEDSTEESEAESIVESDEESIEDTDKESDESPVIPKIGSKPTVPKAPPRRRLVQGLRTHSSPVNSQYRRASSDDPLAASDVEDGDAYKQVINLSSDEEDEDSSLPLEDRTRLLECINTTTVEDLAAMTKVDRELVETFLSKRPFVTVKEAAKVFALKKGKRKGGRNHIGQAIIDTLTEFQRATKSIDKIVVDCERHARAVKNEMASWDVDMFGRKRGSPSPDNTQPPTPTSIKDGKVTNLPLPRQPKLMDGHCEMKSFQLFGLNWLNLLYQRGFGCILGDEMGLGKTCQVISLVAHLAETEEENWPSLIVVPPSTYSNWLAEFTRFAPGVSVIGYQGSQTERSHLRYDILDDPSAYNVILSTYTQVQAEEDVDFLRELKPNIAVFDEGHKMKNPNTKTYLELKKIPAKWRLLLTGTPIQNNLLEMTALLAFINPQMFQAHDEHLRYMFSNKISVRDIGNGAFLHKERIDRAKTMLEPFILQRRKQQVIDMPKKTRSVVHCELSKSQRSLYERYEAAFRAEPSKRPKAAGRANDHNNVWIQLRKASLHPQLFRRHFTDEKVAKMARILFDTVDQTELGTTLPHLTQELKNSSDFELHLWCRDYPQLARFDVPDGSWVDSGKVTKLLELIQQYRENGERVLVFSKFAKVVEILREVMFTTGIQHCVLYGQTAVSERQEIIDEFQNDTDISVFLLTTQAGGTGINLTAANRVIIFDQSENPQDDIQAENRAHRLGQTRDVEIIRLIAKDTIEELIYKACEKKIELAQKVTGSGEDGEANLGANIEAEVRKMLDNQKQLTPP